MRAIAAYIMRGPTQAVAVSASCGLLALLLPPLSYLSGGAVALVTLRRGPKQGALVIGGAILAAALLSLLVLGSALPASVLALALWLPLWVLALTLRRSVSLVVTVHVAALLGLLWVLAWYAWLRDPASWWVGVLEGLRPTLEQVAGGTSAELDQRLRALAEVMTGAVGAAMVLSLLLNLFLARWWQSLLYHPGGFRAEFYGLRLGQAMGAAALVAFALALLADGAIAKMARDGLWVLLAVAMLSGLSLLHSLAARLKAHIAWLVALYALLLIDPVHLLPALAVLGLADSWLNLRAYFPKGSAS